MKGALKKWWFEQSPMERYVMTTTCIVAEWILAFVAIINFFNGHPAREMDTLTLLAVVLVVYFGAILLFRLTHGVFSKLNPELCEWLDETHKPYAKARKEKKEKDPDLRRKTEQDNVATFAMLALMVCFLSFGLLGNQYIGEPFDMGFYYMLMAPMTLACIACLCVFTLIGNRINRSYGRMRVVLEDHKKEVRKSLLRILAISVVIFVALNVIEIVAVHSLTEWGYITEISDAIVAVIISATMLNVMLSVLYLIVKSKPILDSFSIIVQDEYPDDPSLAFGMYLFNKRD